MISTDQFCFFLEESRYCSALFFTSMDPCHVLVFLGRIDSHLHDLAQTEVSFCFEQNLVLKNVQVDLEASVVDPELKQMTIRYKDGGVIEELLGL